MARPKPFESPRLPLILFHNHIGSRKNCVPNIVVGDDIILKSKKLLDWKTVLLFHYSYQCVLYQTKGLDRAGAGV